ncbi:MAG: bifunctional aspartokinase / homoserine dehydrogenase 1 [Bacteroidetes bacterium]|nr:MAG: bifunctional aspartokinase / homoserine dehydrogenase 1 [Bacteroidota bacterium]
MKILKFGGTSVGNTEAIGILTDLVRQSYQAGEHPLVVCSAMSGVTNALIDLSQKASEGKNTNDDMWKLREKHMLVMESFFCENKAVWNLLEPLFAELQMLLGGIQALHECSARTTDRVMSLGEQLSCTLIAAIINESVSKAIYIDARRLIATNSRFGNAQVNEAVTNERIRSWHASLGDTIAVVTGFIAADAKGDTTTLGRGGSDYTAALFGAALSADEIQIWTDVDGFMTADPRMVKNAFTLTELSYKEAMELSYFGAKVIYPPTLIPAIAKHIPIRIKNTFNALHPGTAIVPQVSASTNIIKGISSIRKVSLINVEGNGMVGLKGFGGRLFGAMAAVGVNVILITQASSEHSISFAVIPDDTSAALDAIRKEFEMELFSNKIEPPQADTQCSILAVVGENMRNTKGLSGKLFQSLGRSGVNVIAIAQGSSELNISVVISDEDLSKALNAVHDSLFLSPVKTLHLFIAGTGTIGTELLTQLAQSEENLRRDHQLYLQVMGITNSRKMMINNNGGIDLKNWKEELFSTGENADIDGFVQQIEKLNLPNSIFIDNTSNPFLIPHYEKLFDLNVAVVACNKLGASGSYESYSRLKKTARRNGVDFFFETNVGAGLPIIKTMNDLLISGDRFLRIEAILSGTISFIFNNFTHDRSFAEVVKEAQEKGFTEPDPRDDLNGMDFSRKMLILAREAGWKPEMEDVDIEPILPESCLKATSIEAFYKELKNEEEFFNTLKNKALLQDKVVRYIGLIENGEIKIQLRMVGRDHPFYSLSGSDNIISFTTMRYANNPLVVKGPGAGAAVTAAGVFADILRASKN